jgi:hypothetical protein
MTYEEIEELFNKHPTYLLKTEAYLPLYLSLDRENFLDEASYCGDEDLDISIYVNHSCNYLVVESK